MPEKADCEFICQSCKATFNGWHGGKCPRCGSKLIHADLFEGE